ncbi:MAG: hypothetical protein AB7C91_03290 [Sphaerochaeta sp.]|uniref:hypothetical protein n=1 Tax=Sphaerochaeta sp. TaxID=1972642 RepID=UPI002FCC9706
MRIGIITTISIGILLQASLMFAATFPTVEGKHFDGKAFQFPADLLDDRPLVIALTLSSSRKNGEQQQEELLLWHEGFKTQPSLIKGNPVYNLTIVGGAPFFVRGAIRKGIAEGYEPQLSGQEGGVVFLSDTRQFINDAGIPIDGQPTLVVVDPDGSIRGYVKGTYRQQNLQALSLLLER